MEREGGNGAAPYAWTVDTIARERLDRLEERADAQELRLDSIEDDRKDRRRRLDDLGGFAKAIRSVFVTAAAIAAAVLAWLNYARH